MNDKETLQLIQEWLFFVDGDLKQAELALEEEIYYGTCFHAQQAAEKALKAYLVRHHGTPPKIHSLSGLLDLDPKFKRAFGDVVEEVEFLDRFYIPTRYPEAFPGSLPEGLPTQADAERALECAERIVEFVKESLGLAQESITDEKE